MAPVIPPSVPIPVGQPHAAIHADPSLWDRISTWVSENKAVVYTIVGVTVVVTTAGAVYYIKNNSVRPRMTSSYRPPSGLVAVHAFGIPITLGYSGT